MFGLGMQDLLIILVIARLFFWGGKLCRRSPVA
jgi:Sec-independent protein translocase protein TatA